MVAGRRNRGIGRGLHVCLDVWIPRELAPRSVFIGLLHPIGCWADLARSGVLQARRGARETFEARQLFQRNIDFNHGALGLKARDAVEEIFVEICVGAELQESTLRVCI